MSLSVGSVAAMKHGDKNLQPVLQVLSIKGVMSAGAENAAPTRYRLLLMDGQDYISAMAATQLNATIAQGGIKEFTLLRVDQYMINDVNQQKMCVILKCEVVGQLDHQVPGLVINAEGYTTANGGQHMQQQQHAAPMYQQAPAPVYSAPPVNNYGQQQQQPNAAYGAYGQPHQQAPPAPMPAYNNSYSAPSAVAAAPSYNNNNPYSNALAGGNTGSYGSGAQNSRPVQRDDSSQSITPISAINPYSSRWTIKARITSKGDLKRWSNAKGEGTLFSIDLLDSTGGEIRATFFKDACDKFYGVLEEGKVYTFSGGVLKVVANRQFSTLKNNYELTFNANSEINAASDDVAIKSQSYNFVKIDKIGAMEPGNTVDIIGIVKHAGDCSEITSTKLGGKTLNKRDLTLVDDSFNEIRLTLWGEKAVTPYEWGTNPIVAIKGCKIGDYQGRTLSTMAGSSVTLNPQTPEGHALNHFRSQYANGMIPTSASLSNGGGGGGAGGNDFLLERRKAIQSIKDDSLGMGEKPDYLVVKGSVSYIKHDTDCWYTACPTPQCNKKVTEGMSGNGWQCEKCNMNFPECQRRFIMSMTMSDHSGNTWFSLFNESAEKILGVTAQQLHEMRSQGDEAGYDAVFTAALFKTYLCKVRVKQEAVNDEMRVKCTVATLASIDYVAESKQLIDAINKYQ